MDRVKCTVKALQSFVNQIQLYQLLTSGATMPEDVSYDSLKLQSTKKFIRDRREVDPIIMN